MFVLSLQHEGVMFYVKSRASMEPPLNLYVESAFKYSMTLHDGYK